MILVLVFRIFSKGVPLKGGAVGVDNYRDFPFGIDY
jgi:hypothetical protein